MQYRGVKVVVETCHVRVVNVCLGYASSLDEVRVVAGLWADD